MKTLHQTTTQQTAQIQMHRNFIAEMPHRILLYVPWMSWNWIRSARSEYRAPIPNPARWIFTIFIFVTSVEMRLGVWNLSIACENVNVHNHRHHLWNESSSVLYRFREEQSFDNSVNCERNGCVSGWKINKWIHYCNVCETNSLRSWMILRN